MNLESSDYVLCNLGPVSQAHPQTGLMVVLVSLQGSREDTHHMLVVAVILITVKFQ